VAGITEIHHITHFWLSLGIVGKLRLARDYSPQGLSTWVTWASSQCDYLKAVKLLIWLLA
jgi:hypothetical protein